MAYCQFQTGHIFILSIYLHPITHKPLPLPRRPMLSVTNCYARSLQHWIRGVGKVEDHYKQRQKEEWKLLRVSTVLLLIEDITSLLLPFKTFWCVHKKLQAGPAQPHRGNYPQKIWVGVWGMLLETLTLFQTKICDFPCPISGLTQNLIPISDQTPTLVNNNNNNNIYLPYFSNNYKLIQSTWRGDLKKPTGLW